MAAPRLVLLSKKMIKPSSPTPLSHRIHKLSLLDQMGTHSYIPLSFFYPKQDTASSPEPSKVSQILENSLSKVLTAYYPFAGRIRDNSFVECNDMGVDLFQVRIDCSISSIFHHPRTDIDNLVLPKDPWIPSTGSLIVAQLCHFECGGIALGLCLSHKVNDAHGVASFLRDWAMVASDSEAKPSPLFNGSSIFKPANYSSSPHQMVVDPPINQNVSKRYHFSASKLKALKALISADSGSQIHPTTVEAITAFLCKCVNTPTFTPSLLIQAVNLRGKNNDALVPADLFGNTILPFTVSVANKEDLDLQRLVGELSKRKQKIRDMLKYIKSEELLCSMLSEIAGEMNDWTSSNNFSLYRFSSLRKFPLHDINFGWGRPGRVDLATFPVNMFVLLDNQSEDGVEVLVNLEEGEMSAFERNDELIQFASPCLRL